MCLCLQSFARQVYSHDGDISQLQYSCHLLRQSSIAATVNSAVQELTDKWNQLISDTNDKEVLHYHTIAPGPSLVAGSRKNTVLTGHTCFPLP